MNTPNTKTREEYEQQLTQIVHKLPLERVTQIIDFARFIETQTEGETEADETEAAIRASNARWDTLLSRPEAQAKLIEMADEALAEDDAGLTFEMEFDEQGNLIPPARK